MSQKYYVVWKGRQPGIYEDWEDAKEQVENFTGAKCKAYSALKEAVEAFRSYSTEGEASLGDILNDASRHGIPAANSDYFLFPEIDLDGWAVDASCLGNPGRMEYRGVELSTGRELFRVGPFEDATNNIGEFLAIVHALALQFRNGERHTIYSDSRTGMAWVRNRQVKTKLQHTARTARVFELLHRGIEWLHSHPYTTPILKWQTELWGEIPADFNRK